jgi:hypothetical protein
MACAVVAAACAGRAQDGGTAAPMQKPAVTFASGPNLFVDDYLIAASRDLQRTTHQPEKHPGPVFHVTPGNVRYDAARGRFQMRYSEWNPRLYALAESADGIAWEKPVLGVVEVDGSTQNNYLDGPRGGFQGQFWDDGPACADPARRYKLAYFVAEQGMCVTFSADGLRFTAYPGNPVIREQVGNAPYYAPGYENIISDIIKGCWDPLTQEYLLVCKVERGGYPGKPHHHVEGWRRCVGVSSSKDFVTWEPPRVVIAPDPRNGLEEFYAFAPLVRGNLYLGLLAVLRDDLAATPGGPVEGIGWTELVSSRDRQTWTRYQEPFLDRDPRDGRFDHAMAWCCDVTTVGDQEYIYYAALLSGHKTDKDRGRKTGLAILRRNGFVSRDAGPAGGWLKTPAAVLPGSALTVNAAVRGELRVKLVDAAGTDLPGFGWDDCLALHGDAVAHPVRWKERVALPQGATASLEFMLSDAELYGFDVAD